MEQRRLQSWLRVSLLPAAAWHLGIKMEMHLQRIVPHGMLSVSLNSQTNILPLRPAIPSGWELLWGHAGHHEPVALKQLCLHKGFKTERSLAFKAMYVCRCSMYSNCSGGQHLPHATEWSLKSSKEKSVSHTVCVYVYGRYGVSPLCLMGLEEQVEKKMLMRGERCQALSLLLISLQRQVIESQQPFCTVVTFIFCLSLGIPYRAYTYLHFGQ